jgi:hypothetical protein
MTQRATLRHKDLERLIKAAENTNSYVRIDLKTLVATVLSLSEMTEADRLAATRGFGNDGTSGWNSQTELPDDFAL